MGSLDSSICSSSGYGHNEHTSSLLSPTTASLIGILGIGDWVWPGGAAGGLAFVLKSLAMVQ